jgi:co-chaperonin GroES (HSP10)
VKIDRAFQDEIITEGGVKFFLDTSYHPEHHATITGELVSVPKRLGPDYRQQGNFVNMEAGDKICFSYLVVFDRGFDDTAKHFYKVEEIEGVMQLWVNNSFEKIRITRFDDMVAGVYTNEAGLLVDGIQHKGHRAWDVVQAWLGKFSLEGSAIINYNNALEIDGDVYWRCDWRYVFFKVDRLVSESGEQLRQEITMAPGYCLVFPESRQTEYQGRIELLQPVLSNYTAESAGRVIANGPTLWGRKEYGLKNGDKILFDKNFAEKYVINGQEVLILKHRYIIAKL